LGSPLLLLKHHMLRFNQGHLMQLSLAGLATAWTPLSPSPASYELSLSETELDFAKVDN
jgi:hypothetical protein